MSREERAIQVAIATSVIGATVKLAAGLTTGSMSMVSSAVDSIGDLFVSIANLFVVRVSASAPDDDHNYGHEKAEGLGAMFEGGFVFAAAIFICYEAVHKAIVGEPSHHSLFGIVVMLPVLAMTVGTVIHLRKVARETGSLVVKSDALHYLTDVWVNVGVLVSLALVAITGQPLVDTAISILIALTMMRSSVHIVREGLDLVMDKSLDDDVVQRIKTVLAETPRIRSYHDFRTRRGKHPHVDFHVVVPDEMTAVELHDLFDELQDRIHGITGESTRVLLHADPASRIG